MNLYLLKLKYESNSNKYDTEKEIIAVDESTATTQATTIISELSEYTVTVAQLVTVGPSTDLLGA